MLLASTCGFARSCGADIAPRGIEPLHADSKSAALSAELRGRTGRGRLAQRLPPARHGGDRDAATRLLHQLDADEVSAEVERLGDVVADPHRERLAEVTLVAET